MPELFGDAGYKAVDDAYASFAYSEFATAQSRGQLKNAPNCTAREIGTFIATVASHGISTVVYSIRAGASQGLTTALDVNKLMIATQNSYNTTTSPFICEETEV